MKKRTAIWIFPLAVMGIIIMLNSSCNKKDVNNGSPLVPGIVVDIDGNHYHTITIGTQVWMVENLKTTRFRDGSSIPLVILAQAWDTLMTPGYCWYDNDAGKYKNPYGALYNWYAVNTGKLSPAGWHVPTEAEWSTLTDFLGGSYIAGGKMKEADTTHWWSPNTGADNSSGFTALPGGVRNNSGSFMSIGEYGGWLSSTEDNYNPSFIFLWCGSSQSTSGYTSPADGFSVRCIKD
jgi:uncharacterized protein (TIGR02145 family)